MTAIPEEVVHHRVSFQVAFDTNGTEEQAKTSVDYIRSHLMIYLHRPIVIDNITVTPKFKIESA